MTFITVASGFSSPTKRRPFFDSLGDAYTNCGFWGQEKVSLIPIPDVVRKAKSPKANAFRLYLRTQSLLATTPT